MKLRPKIILSSGLPLVVASICAMALALTFFYRSQLDTTQTHLSGIATIVANEVEDANMRATDAAELLAVSQTAGLFGQRQQSSDLAYALLLRFPYLTGAYFGYEPNADGQDSSATDTTRNTLTMNANGRFLPYWFRDSAANGRLALTPLVDMETSYYYRGIKNRVAGKPESEGIRLEGGISLLAENFKKDVDQSLNFIVTEPYVYEGKFIVEYTSPIIIKGEFVGIAGVDRALNDIDSFLSNLTTYDSEQYVLLSSRGRVISATQDPELRGHLIEDTPLLELAEHVWSSTHQDATWQYEDRATGEVRYAAAKRIPTGNWTLIVSISREELLRAFWKFFFQIGSLTLLGSLFAIFITIRLVARIVKQLETAAATAKVIADGDLTQHLKVQSNDETGVLFTAIEHMTSSLRALIGDVRQTATRLNEVARAISNAAGSQRDTNLELADASDQASSSIAQISDTSNELRQTMASISETNSETNRVAGQGRDEITQMQETILAFAQAATTISRKLAVISDRANSIGSIVTTINKVADQTNLLSLNAAIEAEKAGEHGQGFSVVAREIRRLADQTALATSDIEQIVEDMQNSVVSGVMEMDRFDEQIRNGVEESEEISKNLATIIARVEALKPRLELASHQVSAQSKSAESIGFAMQQLQTVADASNTSSIVLDDATKELEQAVTTLGQNINLFKTS
jgi:methyl-accepting chemotaxis protein WspA